jgi:hypothetical protein
VAGATGDFVDPEADDDRLGPEREAALGVPPMDVEEHADTPSAVSRMATTAVTATRR